MGNEHIVADDLEHSMMYGLVTDCPDAPPHRTKNLLVVGQFF